jgi:hypothetical protein
LNLCTFQGAPKIAIEPGNISNYKWIDTKSLRRRSDAANAGDRIHGGSGLLPEFMGPANASATSLRAIPLAQNLPPRTRISQAAADPIFFRLSGQAGAGEAELRGTSEPGA